MDTKETIDALNKLIVINNDRIEGYETASEGTDELDLKALFAQFSHTSQQCKQELVSVVTGLGGEPAEGTRASGKIYRVWMDIKAAVTGKDRKAILNLCEYGEDIAVNTYDEVLKDSQSELSVEHVRLISAQRMLIKADHDKVKQMRDAMAEA
jgi:uncharacterized protein (TIGR02284 family)